MRKSAIFVAAMLILALFTGCKGGNGNASPSPSKMPSGSVSPSNTPEPSLAPSAAPSDTMPGGNNNTTGGASQSPANSPNR